MSDGPYKTCGNSKQDDPHCHSISGPGNGLGYYAWYLYPENTFEYKVEAENIARLMNLAFREGQLARSREIKALIG